MADISQKELNDPEYRWYHKKEMAGIMPYVSKRNQFGVKTLNYEELRNKNDTKIKPCKDRHFSIGRLALLIDSVPKNIDKSDTKESLSLADRLHFEKRDKGCCKVCWQINHYGSHNPYLYGREYAGAGLSHLHHVIPNGKVSDENIVTLCTHCHQAVHQILYLCGKWKYQRPL